MGIFLLSGEDEEWVNEGGAEAMAAEVPGSPPLPRLRLNTSLATDPATRAASAPTPTPPPAPVAAAEYMATLPQALQSAFAAGLFPLPFPVESQTPPSTARSPSVPLEVAQRQLTQPLYMCSPCGIKFSSPSTLEAHQTYYCSHRVTKPTTDGEDGKASNTDASSANAQEDSSAEGPNKALKTGKQYTCSHCSYSADKKVSLNRHMRMHSVSPSPPSLPGSTISNGDTNPDLSSPPIQLIPDRYCADCDIRFSSTKTFRAHKMHYCSTRQVVKSNNNNSTTSATSTVAPKSGSSCTSGSAPPSPNDACKSPSSPTTTINNNQQPLLALPTNPILIVPYSLFRGASVLSGSTVPGLPNPDTPCFLMPNGTIQPMTQAFPGVVRPSLPSTPSEVLKAANKPREPQISKDPSIPLDLSVRRTPENKDSLDDQEKENRLQQSITPEQIVCAPSLPGSPPLTPSPKQSSSPNSNGSPKRKYQESRSNSPKQTTLTPKSNSDESIQLSPKCKTPILMTNPMMPFPVSVTAALHPILLRSGSSIISQDNIALRLAELPGLQASPQVLVKQGVSKCKECNIVFCKYENYVAHKKHYCSARGNQEDGDGSKSTGSPPVSPNNNSTGKTSPVAQYQQLICAACGIKFTSLDNLTAHQSYYCLKRSEIQVNNLDTDLRKCPKCKNVLEPGHVCSNSVGAEGGGWRCPCCNVVSATASAAQRHMDSHGGVKAFRCTICRYKGNTLRGMRTHIRMHFPKRAADLQVNICLKTYSIYKIYSIQHFMLLITYFFIFYRKKTT